MSNDVKFSLDAAAASDILTDMALPIVERSAQAIAARAQAMAQSMSSDPPTIDVTTQVGTIRRGVRAISTVRSEGKDAHQNYIGQQALSKSKDAGRLN